MKCFLSQIQAALMVCGDVESNPGPQTSGKNISICPRQVNFISCGCGYKCFSIFLVAFLGLVSILKPIYNARRQWVFMTYYYIYLLFTEFVLTVNY